MGKKKLLLEAMDWFGLLLIVCAAIVLTLGGYFLRFFGLAPITLTPGDYVTLAVACGVGIMLMTHRIRYKIENKSQTSSSQAQQHYRK